MTASKKQVLLKVVCLVVALVLAGIAGYSFYDQRHYKETVVVSDALTDVRWLSDYVPMLKGTYGDTPIFVFDSGVEGGSCLYVGGTHPYEPATSLSAYILMENIQVEKGVVYVIPQASFSATTLGVQGNAYPSYYTVETEWGEQKYKIGERNTNPLDQWPDNFTYINYPSGQSQAYNDLRNLNRCYPGRLDGTFTERVAYAIMEFIRTEEIDISFDCHEASIMYPVVGTYVAHQNAENIAMMASMDLTGSGTFDMKYEASPNSLKGFTHREWGDYSDTLAILMETPEPFIDRIVGPITEDLMMTGKDLFLSFAGDKGMTYVKYTEENDYSWPMEVRVGRHLTGAMKCLEYLPQFYPEKEVIATWPSYNEVVEKGVGAFLHDPSTADPAQVYEVYCERFEYKGKPASAEEETVEPEASAEVEPSEEPTVEPTEEPVEEATEAPTEEPTEAPTAEPTEAPTEKPTEAPTDEPAEEEPVEAQSEAEPTDDAEPTAAA